jgi:hypothetical protein
MKLETFADAIRTFRKRTPYHPFTIVTVSGEKYEIDHPEAILERDGVAMYAGPGGKPVIFDHEGVSEIVGDLANRETGVNF